MSCPCGSVKRHLVIEGLEAERPRLVRISSLGPEVACSSIPLSIRPMGTISSRSVVMGSAPAASEPGTKAIIEHQSGPKRYSIAFEGSKHHHANIPHPRGILKQPTSAFPFENDRHSRPHIAPKPIESVRLEVGQPSHSKPPASDIMKVHAYRRRGNSIAKDRDSTIVCDKIEIGTGDILVGGSVMPEASNVQNVQAATAPEGPQW